MADGKPWMQELEDEFLALLGKCITEWSLIEEELFTVCYSILGTTQERAAIVYYRTPTIETRLNLADELVRTAFPLSRPDGGKRPREHKHWEHWLGKIRDELAIRNRLAHSPASPQMDDFSLPLTPRDVYYATYMHPFERVRGKSADKKPLKKSDLQTHLKRIGTLYLELRNFERLTLSAALKTV